MGGKRRRFRSKPESTLATEAARWSASLTATTVVVVISIVAMIATYAIGKNSSTGDIDATGKTLIEVFSHVLTLSAGAWVALFKTR